MIRTDTANSITFGTGSGCGSFTVRTFIFSVTRSGLVIVGFTRIILKLKWSSNQRQLVFQTNYFQNCNFKFTFTILKMLTIRFRFFSWAWETAKTPKSKSRKICLILSMVMSDCEWTLAWNQQVDDATWKLAQTKEPVTAKELARSFFARKRVWWKHLDKIVGSTIRVYKLKI